ncbi:hypothetical protein QUA42_26855 [Microcoleus sp. Pol11C2]|uniref:hypothetical protein n=1 Tax=Microcoleus sp. Pol11C2 TaxID=3055389 RepID=UPI002FD435E8
MPVIETSIDKAWGFSTHFFHTLIKQRQHESDRTSVKEGRSLLRMRQKKGRSPS